MRGFDRILLKNVWLILIVCLLYILARQGWPSPFIDTLVFKTTAASIGALVGMWVDSHHFKNWTPSTNDPSPVNMLRRAGLIAVGMLALSIAV